SVAVSRNCAAGVPGARGAAQYGDRDADCRNDPVDGGGKSGRGVSAAHVRGAGDRGKASGGGAGAGDRGGSEDLSGAAVEAGGELCGGCVSAAGDRVRLVSVSQAPPQSQ